MYDIIKDHEDYARKEGRKEGKKEAYLNLVKRMLDKGLSPEMIREYLGLTQKQLDDFTIKHLTI